jgi:hypothetical protein
LNLFHFSPLLFSLLLFSSRTYNDQKSNPWAVSLRVLVDQRLLPTRRPSRFCRQSELAGIAPFIKIGIQNSATFFGRGCQSFLFFAGASSQAATQGLEGLVLGVVGLAKTEGRLVMGTVMWSLNSLHAAWRTPGQHARSLVSTQKTT